MRVFPRSSASGLLAVLLACSHGPEMTAPSAAPSAVPVRTLTVEASQRAPTTTLTGVLVADLEVAIRPETAGVIEAVRFVDGQVVRRGQALVALRDEEAGAAMAEAEAALTLAEAEVARTETLASHDHASVAAVDAARASRDLAKARRQAAEEKLRRTVVRAPFDGRLGTRDVAPGDTVDPGRVITTLTDPDPLRAEVEVPERLASWLKPGLDATVVVDAAREEPVHAEVDFVDPAVTASSRTVRVRAALDRIPDGVRPGMTAEVTLELDSAEPVLRVPAEAVLTRSDGASVWVVEGGKAALRSIHVGERLSTDVVVTSGLAAGDMVVVQGIARLRPGIEVKVLGPPEGATAEAR
jgi:membrane fusion protein (multidrug efflux system)